MTVRWILACVGLAAIGCSQREPAPDSARAAAGSALGAARGVASVAGAGGDAFRVVPLRGLEGDVEILLGHPDSAGQPFVMRIRELPGTVVPPHTHPVDEHITVVSGTWYFGQGERFDSSALRELKTGAYAFARAGTSMFAYSPEGAVVQVHGVGPFHIHWRDRTRMLDVPADTVVFRYRKGDAVITRRGAGRIRQGYASGTLVQYEIEGEGGTLYMAHERDVRRR